MRESQSQAAFEKEKDRQCVDTAGQTAVTANYTLDNSLDNLAGKSNKGRLTGLTDAAGQTSSMRYSRDTSVPADPKIITKAFAQDQIPSDANTNYNSVTTNKDGNPVEVTAPTGERSKMTYDNPNLP